MNLGFALMRQGKPDEASPEFLAAVRLKPLIYEAHSLLGVALSEQGNVR